MVRISVSPGRAALTTKWQGFEPEKLEDEDIDWNTVPPHSKPDTFIGRDSMIYWKNASVTYTTGRKMLREWPDGRGFLRDQEELYISAGGKVVHK